MSHITIKKTSSDPKYKDVRFKTWGNVENPGPHYYLNTGPAELFAKKVDEARNLFTPEEKISIDYERDSHFLLGHHPELVVADRILHCYLGVHHATYGRWWWRKPDFQYRKIKAQLFDKDLQVRVTFNDVAGLEEAKVEVMEIVDFLKTLKNTHYTRRKNSTWRFACRTSWYR